MGQAGAANLVALCMHSAVVHQGYGGLLTHDDLHQAALGSLQQNKIGFQPHHGLLQTVTGSSVVEARSITLGKVNTSYLISCTFDEGYLP